MTGRKPYTETKRSSEVVETTSQPNTSKDKANRRSEGRTNKSKGQ